MSFLLHRKARLFNTQEVLVREMPLVPAILEDKLPHCILCDLRLFLLLERCSATYKEVIPHLIPGPLNQ